MSSFALSGDDSIILNDKVLADFADANYGEGAFPNDIATVKVGKNGNALFSQNASGKQFDLTLRMVRGSKDDIMLQGLLTAQDANFAGTTLLAGQVVKRVGDGKGNLSADTYVLAGGVFNKNVPVTANAEGDTNQSVAVYALKFSRAARVIS
jgi:hypothetical protein